MSCRVAPFNALLTLAALAALAALGASAGAAGGQAAGTPARRSLTGYVGVGVVALPRYVGSDEYRVLPGDALAGMGSRSSASTPAP